MVDHSERSLGTMDQHVLGDDRELRERRALEPLVKLAMERGALDCVLSNLHERSRLFI